MSFSFRDAQTLTVGVLSPDFVLWNEGIVVVNVIFSFYIYRTSDLC